MSTILTGIGLVADIVGVVLLYFFGLPAHISRGGHSSRVAEQRDDVEAQQAKLYDLLARVGIWVLIAGFALQLAGVVVGPRQ
ncbi:MAG: hypothetical protein M3282_06335 [Gemmatimonadota bacterium]|nr:hypothetical protein [Gemmatimonadota bacterium]